MDYRKLYTWLVIADKSMQPNMAELSRAADAGVEAVEKPPIPSMSLLKCWYR